MKPSCRRSTSTSPVSSALTSTKSKATGWSTSGSGTGSVGTAAAGQVRDPVRQPGERPLGLLSGAHHVGLPEGVVEHLQRDRARIARLEAVPDERGEVEGALPGEEPMVSAPRQHVHGQRRCVCQLDEEDLVAGDPLDRRWVVAAGEDVEAVEAGAHGRMVGALDDPPSAPVVVDEPAPGERLVGQPHAVRRGLVAQPTELLGRHVVIVDRGGADIAADQHGVDAETLHQPELRSRASYDVGELLLGDSLRVAEGLVEVERQPQATRQRGDLLRARGFPDQIRLEDLHAVEPGLGTGVQLLDQGAAQAHRGDRSAHRHPPSPRSPCPRAGVSRRAGLTSSS